MQRAYNDHSHKQKSPLDFSKGLFCLWYQLESNQRHKDFQSFSLAVSNGTKTALIASNKRF